MSLVPSGEFTVSLFRNQSLRDRSRLSTGLTNGEALVVRVEAGPTTRRQARAGENVPRTARPGLETEFNFESVIPMAQRLSAAGPKAPILLRLDSGFDSVHLTRTIEACNRPGLPQVDFLVKWNPRSTDVAGLAARLDGECATRWEHPRAGKRVTTWEQLVEIDGITRPVRRVLRLIERAIDAARQVLIEPRLTLEGWTTSLPATQFSAKPSLRCTPTTVRTSSSTPSSRPTSI